MLLVTGGVVLCVLARWRLTHQAKKFQGCWRRAIVDQPEDFWPRNVVGTREIECLKEIDDDPVYGFTNERGTLADRKRY